MSSSSVAGRLSPKPLRFVPYNPDKKIARKPRKNNSRGGRPDPTSAPASVRSTLLNQSTTAAAAATSGSIQPSEGRDGLSTVSGQDNIGEWYQAMGFGFLPQEHNQTSRQNTGGQELPLPLSLQSNSQEHGFDPGIACKTSNALASSSRLPEESSSDVVQRPCVFDQLYSWEDLMMRGGSDTWIPESQRSHPRSFTIPVFRWFGNTSIAPGIVKTQARIKQLDRKQTPKDSCSPSSETSKKGTDIEIDLFDSQDSTYPSEAALSHLLDVFITHFMCHFPFLDSVELRRSNQDRKLSKGLVNSICALASRFSGLPRFLDSNGKPDFSICDSYADAAKQALLPLLEIPTLEVLQSFILLTWSEWGNDRDAGFWMYSGICVRMAQDLGLASGIGTELNSNTELAQQSELTFWAVFFLDRVVSYGTGRRVSLSEEDIQIPLPHSSIGGVPYEEVPRNPWFVMIRILRYRGMVGDIINAKKMTGTESASLAFLQREMADYYRSLPQSLQFTPQNFQLYKYSNQTSTFTLIHLLFHATIILLHRPSLLQASEANINFALTDTLHDRSKEISRSSARSIADILHYVELLGPSQAIYCNLFVDHAIFLTAMSFLADLADERQDTDSMLSILADTQFQRCRSALRKLASYWGGAEFVCRVIDQRSAGLTKGVVHSVEDREPRPIIVEYALDRLPGGFLPSISMTRPGSPTLGGKDNLDDSRRDTQSDQGLSFAGLLDPEPLDGQIALVGQAWLGSNLLSLQTGTSPEGQGGRQDRFMLLQDPYA